MFVMLPYHQSAGQNDDNKITGPLKNDTNQTFGNDSNKSEFDSVGN
jgi:hypothetical protein